jgi:hypothetical protein
MPRQPDMGGTGLVKITSARIWRPWPILAGLSAAIALHQAFSPDGEGRPGEGVLHLAFPCPFFI